MHRLGAGVNPENLRVESGSGAFDAARHMTPAHNSTQPLQTAAKDLEP